MTMCKFGNKRSGFNLVEIMIAIGVLGVGIAMAAALFPAAVTMSERSSNDVIGQIICENGLATTKAVLKQSNYPAPIPPNLFSVIADDNITGILSSNDQKYAGQTDTGFVVLGRELIANEAYQLVLVSYKNSDPTNNSVEAVNVQNCTTSYNAAEKRYELTGGGMYAIKDALIILDDDGSYARIIGIDGVIAVLDHEVPLVTNKPVWFVPELDSGSNPISKSPVMSVLVARTGLPEN